MTDIKKPNKPKKIVITPKAAVVGTVALVTTTAAVTAAAFVAGQGTVQIVLGASEVLNFLKDKGFTEDDITEYVQNKK